MKRIQARSAIHENHPHPLAALVQAVAFAADKHRNALKAFS
jgi:hypothetical protein